jgi:hypothetical protein
MTTRKIRKTRKTREPRRAKPVIGRATAMSLGAVAIAAGGALFAILARGRRTYAASAEHAAPDLAPDLPHPGPDHRAPVDFRPDPTAPVSLAEREALRPPAGFPSRTSH